MSDTYLSPTEIISEIKNALTGSYDIKLQGEILTIDFNKHIYLTITDSNSSVKCVIWQNNNIDEKTINELCPGKKIKIKCSVNVYQKTCQISFNVRQIEFDGIGNLIKQQKQNLEYVKQMGFLENKKRIPVKINSVGIITAKNGAAIQDIIYVLNNKNFGGNVYVYDSIVQGPNCPKSIIEGINFFEQNYPLLDVILITRGGGSFEDLSSFNDMKIAERIHQSKIFTISAVGHETDNMLTDYVCDYRAPTPSIAAEFISSIYNKSILQIENIKKELNVLVEFIFASISKKIFEKICMIDKIIIPNKLTFLFDTIEQTSSSFKAQIIKDLSNAKVQISRFNSDDSIFKLNAHVSGLITDGSYIVIHMNGCCYKIKCSLIEKLTFD